MDPAEMDKFQAMKARHGRGGRCRLMTTVIVQYGLRVLALGLFLSSPRWLPVARCSAKSLLMVSLPGISGVLMRPLAFFIISNVIIIFLLCESKLARSSPQRPDIYEEYVTRSQSLQKAASSAPTLVQEEEEPSVESESGDKDEEEEEEEEQEMEYDDNEEEEEEDEEELNKRFEDFIARVNMQRKLEAATMVACCG